MNRSRIAIVCQRYGQEVNGGAETLARVWAEQLAAIYHVEVLTTCAVEYTTWANEYPVGVTYINGVPVRRLANDRERDIPVQRKYERIVFQQPRASFRILDEAEFMLAQGPAGGDLIRYIENHVDQYDLFVFVTYLYYSTVVGLPLVAEKSVLIPAAHDEIPFYMDSVRALMNLPRLIFYNTVEEQRFAHRSCHNKRIPSEVVGMGVDVPVRGDLPDFGAETGIRDPYVIYAGRIDEAKNCPELFDFWIRFKKKQPEFSSLQLVMLGKAFIEVPKRDDIHALGFVSEEMKYAAMSGARFMIMPSHQESFSIVIMESLLYAVPVLVNARCDVMKGHIDRGQGGLYYTEYGEFAAAMTTLLTDPARRKQLGEQGCRYVQQNYRWPALLEKITQALDRTIRQIRMEERDGQHEHET